MVLGDGFMVSVRSTEISQAPVHLGKANSRVMSKNSRPLAE